MSAPTVLVAIPARDEQARIADCLHAVRRAASHALTTGAASRIVVAVAAHRCSDETARAARAALDRYTGPTLHAHVVADEGEGPVGAVRSRLVAGALAIAGSPSDGWLCSTDADSIVPATWIADHLAAAARTGADAVAGLVDVVDWEASPAARGAYAQIIAAGLTPDGGHRHAYAANLAVRLRPYLQVGGFPAVRHGEEHALLGALRAAGFRVAHVRSPIVATSGRAPGRAEHGLGDLLAQLEPRGRSGGVIGPVERPA